MHCVVGQQCTYISPTQSKKLEFHRTHTLCVLSTVSTDCTCSDTVGLHSAQHGLQLQVVILAFISIA